MRLACPWGLLLWLPILLAAAAAWRRRPVALPVPDLCQLQHDARAALRYRLPLAFETLGCLLLAVAIARPQRTQTLTHEERETVDIMIALDVSGSMDAVDIPSGAKAEEAENRSSRLTCARHELDQLMRARPEDRFGLVVFARKPYPACPLTFDHALLRARIEDLSTELLDDGTALTTAIALAATHLGTSPSPHRVLVLLTDGRDNVPAIQTPEAATALAARCGITVHVVGIGSPNAVLPIRTLAGVQYRPVETAIDEARLLAIAKAGNGVYVRAGDPVSFRDALRRIDATEKGRVVRRVLQRHREVFPTFVVASLMAVLTGFVLSRTICTTLP